MVLRQADPVEAELLDKPGALDHAVKGFGADLRVIGAGRHRPFARQIGRHRVAAGFEERDLHRRVLPLPVNPWLVGRNGSIPRRRWRGRDRQPAAWAVAAGRDSIDILRPGRSTAEETRHAINALHHVTVKTDDLDATRDFYQEVLGLEVGFRPELDFPGYWLYCGPCRSCIWCRARTRSAAVRRAIPGRSTISPSSPRTSTASRRGSNKGGQVPREPHPTPPIDQLFFPDNNNVMVELNFPRG